MLKTGKQWHKELYPEIIILDYDGFDRYNLEYSYEQELITEEEFQRRMGYCTIIVKECPYPTQWWHSRTYLKDDDGLYISRKDKGKAKDEKS